MIRAWEVERSGRRMLSEPSLGVLVASRTGNVAPPLVESRRSTVAALTGAAVVPATFQVTVRAPDQTTAVFGAVTTNGPAAPATVTVMSSVATPPPPARWSRAVTRKCSVRDVVGSLSPTTVVLFSNSDQRGKVRAGLFVGGKTLKSGLNPSSPNATERPLPESRCSQQKEMASPLVSLPDAVRVKGVPFGIVKSAPALTEGAVFPVTMLDWQDFEAV